MKVAKVVLFMSKTEVSWRSIIVSSRRIRSQYKAVLS